MTCHRDDLAGSARSDRRSTGRLAVLTLTVALLAPLPGAFPGAAGPASRFATGGSAPFAAPPGLRVDCNGNGVDDALDVTGGTSSDCNTNGRPDECEVEGDFASASGPLGPIGTGSPQDYLLIAPPDAGTDVLMTFVSLADYGFPDEFIRVTLNGVQVGTVFDDAVQCVETTRVLTVDATSFNEAVAGGDALITMSATTTVGPDICVDSFISVELQYGQAEDCNRSGVPDDCEVAAGTSEDCNANGSPDECESGADCNGNGVADICDLVGGTSADCNTNAIPDACDLAGGSSGDCNADAVPDECASDADCNLNGVQDICDIAGGTSEDTDTNGVPDECRILYVDIDAVGADTGRSWADAYRDLNDALADATAAGGAVEEIWVAEGTYRPGGPGAGRDAAFRLVNELALLGGFTGIESSSDQRDPDANPTVLSGDLGSNDVADLAGGLACLTGAGIPFPDDCVRFDLDSNGQVDEADLGIADNAYSVVLAAAVRETAVLDGFVITAANTIGQSFAGGGVLVASGGNTGPTIRDCLLTANAAFSGGGASVTASAPVFRGCAFRRNLATGRGGGVLNDLGNVSFLGCRFEFNQSRSGAGMHNVGSTVHVDRCIYVGNVGRTPSGSGTVGGGMANGFLTDVVVSNSAFLANRAGLGGAVSEVGDDPLIRNCLFAWNTADDGGAIHASAVSGGRGGTPVPSFPRLINCTLYGNTAGSSGGGYHHVGEGGPAVRNCILWGNADGTGMSEAAQIGGASAMFDVSYSAIQGLSGTLGGVGNIGLDPLLIDSDGADDVPGTEDDNLRIAAESPCVDAGSPGFAALPAETDLDGQRRVRYGRVDMGAYEFGVGDLDLDRDVDEQDYRLFLPAMGFCGGDGPYLGEADLDSDGCVTLVDYQIWLARYRDFVGDPAAPPPLAVPGDFDNDGDVDLEDYAALTTCLVGPADAAPAGCLTFDLDSDGDIDLGDVSQLLGADD